MSIITERLEQLEKGLVTLDHGSHNDFQEGHCSMEVVSWLAGEGFTDAPKCASPVLTRYTIALNDRWGPEKRQALAPFLPRMVGTGGDGLDGERERVAAEFLTARALGPWLRLAGMDAEADQLAGLAGKPVAEQRQVVRAIRDRAWEVRADRRRALRDRIEKELKALNRPVAVAAAAAVAAAVADAAADAAAVAVAVAAAVAVAVADAVAVAVAAADAVAAAVAGAVAGAAAAAVAGAAAAADADTWSSAYWAARKAADAYYKEHPEIFAHIHELGKAQEPLALELLEAMIKPEGAQA